ncbi:hypothetical protein VNO78_21222 [Psophocarpus tetragonolobus]|uniref:Uncharacterized protein n=1 Tax=Psophocarpus tetragonolobus TaxID=3891 RepID=A0AAN9SCD7_PSOTE
MSENMNIEEFDSDKMIVPSDPSRVDGYLQQNYGVVSVMLPIPSASPVWTPIKISLLSSPPSSSELVNYWPFKPSQITLDLLSSINQPIQHFSNEDPGLQLDFMSVYGLVAAGQVVEPGPLTLGSPLSEAEIEATTLALCPPGVEKEAIKKPKLDLNLKI